MDTEHYSVACHRAIDGKLSAMLEGRNEQPGWYDGDGPFIWVEGLHLGRPTYLRILAEDPRDEAPRAKVSLR